MVVWGASLGGLDSIRRRPDIKALVQFDRSIDPLIELFVVFAAWLFKRSSSGSGNGCLVLGQSSSGSRAVVVWFWSQSFVGYRSGASLSREGVRKEGQKWHLGVHIRGIRNIAGTRWYLGQFK